MLRVIGKSQQQIREELMDKPYELKRHENKLLQAIFNENIFQCFCKRGNKDKSTKLYNQSLSRCEYALEILQNI